MVLEPDSTGPGAHQHDENDEVFYGLEVTASILVDDKWVIIEKRDFLRIPAKAIHDFENRTNKTLEFLTFLFPVVLREKCLLL